MADTGYAEVMPNTLAARPPVSRIALVAAFAAIYVLWGTTYLAIRYAVETLPPFTMAGVRFTIAGGVLFAVARWKGDAAPTAANWRATALIGAMFFLVSHGCLSWAEQRIPSGMAALAVSTIPLWTALAGWAFGESRLTARTWVGLTLGLVGLVVLFGSSGLLKQDALTAAGSWILVLSSLCWAVGSVLARRIAIPTSATLASGMEMLIGGLMLLATGALAGDWQSLTHHAVSLRSVASLAYLIVFGSLIAFTAYVWLLSASTPSRVSTYAFVNPVIAVAAGWLLGGEIVTLPMLMAAAVIAAGVAILVTGKH
ncbi:MAG: EamA family transporter [Candidatus Solibacter usitatus]|nr:EamA family transporter [Candidatus Solibacter usitatus]